MKITLPLPSWGSPALPDWAEMLEFYFRVQQKASLAPPAYVLKLNLNFHSVLGLGLRYVTGFSPSTFSANRVSG